MQNRKINRLSIIMFLGDMILTPIGLFIASYLRTALPYGKLLNPGAERLPWMVYLMAIGSWSISLLLSGAYKTRASPRFGSSVTRLFTASGLATLTLAGLLYFTFREISRLQFGYFLVSNLLLLILFRMSIIIIARGKPKTALVDLHRIVVLGAGDLGREVSRLIKLNPLLGYEVVGYLDDDPEKLGLSLDGLPVLGGTDNLLDVVKEHDLSEVWSTLPPRSYDQLHKLVSLLEKIPIRIKVIPDYFSLALVQARVEMLNGIPIIGLREPIIQGIQRILKRSFDVVVSIFLLVLNAPLMGLISLSILLDSSSPILLRQTRVGENGRLFEMLKFRSMVVDAALQMDDVMQRAEELEEIHHKHKGDPRVTRVGRVLRRLSLDELPQLVNVLRGEMSLVGPRPELPWLVERYKPWQRKRFAVPQGITGWWQINGRGEKPMHLNTDEDLYYIYNYSLWLDVLILLRTPLAVLSGRGAF